MTPPQTRRGQAAGHRGHAPGESARETTRGPGPAGGHGHSRLLPDTPPAPGSGSHSARGPQTEVALSAVTEYAVYLQCRGAVPLQSGDLGCPSTWVSTLPHLSSRRAMGAARPGPSPCCFSCLNSCFLGVSGSSDTCAMSAIQRTCRGRSITQDLMSHSQSTSRLFTAKTR